MGMTVSKTAAGFLTVLAFHFTPAATAVAETFPRIDGAVPIEIQDDLNHRSDNRDNEHNQLSTKIEPEATLHFAPWLSLFAHAVIEQLRNPGPGEDRIFDDQGAFIEDLFVEYHAGWLVLRGGKFTPAFGVAWDIAPGVYGTDFAEAGYELAERIGLAAGKSLDFGRNGAHKVTAHTFFRDTSLLSESTGRGRGTTDLVDGGPGNTEKFNSWAVTLDGSDVAGQKGLGYRLAFIRQAPGRTEQSDEKGISAALFHELHLGAGFTLSPLLEWVHFDDADGIAEQKRNFVTVAGRLGWSRWNISLAHTSRITKASGANEVDDFQAQVSIGCEFDFGLSVDAAWRIANEAGIETRRLGLLFAYTATF